MSKSCKPTRSVARFPRRLRWCVCRTKTRPHCAGLGSVPGPDQPVELQYLLLDPPQLSPECRETRTSYLRNSLVVWIGYDIEQFLDTVAANRRNDPELGKMGPDRIDHRGLLTDEQMARTVEHQAALLLGRLGLDEPHVCPGDCLANGLGVGSLKGCGRIPRSWRTTRQFTLPNRS